MSKPRRCLPMVRVALAATALMSGLAVACGPGTEADGGNAPGRDAVAAVRPPATFRGTLPCADCPGIVTTLELTAEGAATVHRRYIEGEPNRDPEFTETGRWDVDDEGRLTVTTGEASTVYFAFGTDGLAALDGSGQPLPSDLPRTLARVPDGPMAELAGTAWRFVDPAPAGGDAAIPTLRFAADGRLTGSDGCNALTGPWQADAPGALALGPLASTRRACPGDPDAVARAVTAAVTATAAYRMDDGGALVLLGEGGEPVARLRPSP